MLPNLISGELYTLCFVLHAYYLAFFSFRLFLFSDLSVFDIRLLPKDRNGEIIFPQIPREKGITYFQKPQTHFSFV